MSDEIDHIEELQKRLYARDPDAIPKQKYGILRPIKQNVQSSWGDKEIPKDKTKHQLNVGGYKRFFVFSILFFLVAGGLALYSVFRGAVTLSSRNVDVSILGNSFAAAGEEIPIQVEISNKNSSDLLEAELTLHYPKGATDETGSEITRMKEILGTIPSGKTKSVAFTAVLYGEQGSVRNINATLAYKLPNSTAVFEKEQSFAVTINSSPIILTVSGPTVSAPNQSFTLNIRSLFTGDQPLQEAIVRVEYPSGFYFQSASPEPSSGNNVWRMDQFEKGTEQTITLKGKLAGVVSDERSFRIYLGSRVSEIDNRIAVAYNSALHTVLIEQPIISAEIYINGEKKEIVAMPINTRAQGMVNWVNNSGKELKDAVFTLSFEGGGLNFGSVSTENGYTDPLDKTITWNSRSNGELAIVEPGENAQFPFNFSSVNGSTTDVHMSLSVEAIVPEEMNVIKKITDIASVVARYTARIQFAAQSLYSTGPIKNTGPYPPKANQETSYTITWTARPSENPLTNVVAKATLPPGVIWNGVIVPQAETISYNPENRIITWNIGSLPKATNISLSKSVSFQVKARPTTSQIGAEISLLSETTITATDAQANISLSANRPPLSSRLDADPLYTEGRERVVP